jgi:hypothetical protein
MWALVWERAKPLPRGLRGEGTNRQENGERRRRRRRRRRTREERGTRRKCP